MQGIVERGEGFTLVPLSFTRALVGLGPSSARPAREDRVATGRNSRLLTGCPGRLATPAARADDGAQRARHVYTRRDREVQGGGVYTVPPSPGRPWLPGGVGHGWIG